MGAGIGVDAGAAGFGFLGSVLEHAKVAKIKAMVREQDNKIFLSNLFSFLL